MILLFKNNTRDIGYSLPFILALKNMSSDINFSGSVPQNYDRFLGPLLFEPYAKDLVERLNKKHVKRVLELACGTGRVTQHILNKLPAHVQLIATDVNTDMMSVADSKINDVRVIWQAVDAQELPFNDEEFDLIICQFGVMFFENKLKAFTEAYRVLNEGGTFLFNTWDRVEENMLSNLTQQVLLELIKDDPPLFFEQGPFSFFDKDLIKQILQQAGFKNVTLSIVRKETESTDIESMIKGFLDGSPLTNYLQQINAPQQQIRARLKQLILENISSGLPMQAIVCEAVK
jgi:ubiquinone/menaquinone biosynthesis C-methylase UbiE